MPGAPQVPEVVHHPEVSTCTGAPPQALLSPGALPRQAKRAGGVPAAGPGPGLLCSLQQPSAPVQPLCRQQSLG